MTPSESSDRASESCALRAYHRILTSIARRQLGESDAEDIVAEAFLCWFEQTEVAASVECPKAYLIAITKNLVRGEIRRRVRHKRLYEPLDACAKESVSPENASATAALRELSGIFSRLAELDSKAFVLRRVEGHGVSDVADALGVSEATIQRKVASTRRFLRHSAARSAVLSDFL